MTTIREEFPFTEYFSNAPQPLFKGGSFARDWDIAEVRVYVSCRKWLGEQMLKNRDIYRQTRDLSHTQLMAMKAVELTELMATGLPAFL